MDDRHSDITTLLAKSDARLRGILAAEAGIVLLRFESIEDLQQGVHAEAIRSWPNLDWRGEAAFVGWLDQIARRFVLGRRDHWFACKRNAGAAARLSMGGGGHPSSVTGPATFAERREAIALATRAKSLLPVRDRQLVDWVTDGVSTSVMAERLGLGLAATERARSRALERLRKAWIVVGGH